MKKTKKKSSPKNIKSLALSELKKLAAGSGTHVTVCTTESIQKSKLQDK